MYAMAKGLDDYRRESFKEVAEFATFLRISVSTYYNIVRGKHQPRIKTMKRIAKKLKVEPGEIAEFTAKPEQEKQP